jgi:transglutaminase-like putative cysteine protease
LSTFRDAFTYRSRESQGTQSPGETLRTRSGTCRDYAWLMIEALRRLGFASRFVSGYLYDEAPDGGTVGMTSSGATQAWLQVFLPGTGWIDYDPTNQINACAGLSYAFARDILAVSMRVRTQIQEQQSPGSAPLEH